MVGISRLASNPRLEATATNSRGDFIYLGTVKNTKNTRKGWVLEWTIPSKPSTAVFDRIILHQTDRIDRVVSVKPFWIESQNSLKMELT